MLCVCIAKIGCSPENRKAETSCSPVKTHCRAGPLAIARFFVYFCYAMKTLGRIAYWLAALALVAGLLVSLDYSLSEALFVSLIFGPCAIALEYLMPKARKPMDKVYLALAVLVATIVLILVLHALRLESLRKNGLFPQISDVPPMLINPIFLALILTALAIGDYYWSQWLNRRFKHEDRTVTFFSDRRSVTLRVADIDFVESNDTEVRLVTADGNAYRNKTGISQWENLLGEDFLRIHRSYLVNIARSRLVSPEEVIIGQHSLPVSRKYRESVSGTLRPDADAE